ncbi:2,5-diamino-6-(ribosylamino)-4(3H)-pyrimidinone 5'-phosphate reductase [Haloquadratum walsbyi]|uniref:2,5-diamino-6-(ribosylamino)-4(3H)-pyrimidinone 5'-phosphate reductase n=1 Tax=Haloquadratum walsbyi J07HQW2 TaxID=1238425 RepID=U1PQT9_9EURY|nr:2,5-diamino-6-(ribosylamino)-4(3H)-pyrimidinone 5'-phosphate reductase [Haloquadratum walsbyi]ERG94701.1 MAG: 2,5-diamino-6-hydroxy-4-(5-phosphoribosylamino)pyrimidine 1''-reductase, archaeal [Haloquadratum walsbyi J07HQW2]
MHVVVNAAISIDGKLSTRRREQIAISGERDFERVSALRADSDAILVGIGTVLADDPHLVVEEPHRERRQDKGMTPTPHRIIIDSRARTPTDAEVLDDEAPTYIIVSESAPTSKQADLEVEGADVIVAGRERVSMPAALSALTDSGINSIMVEGGGEIIFSLFEANLVDELSVYIGSMLVGGRDAPTLADGDGFVEDPTQLQLTSVEKIDDGVLLQYDVDATAPSSYDSAD